MQLNQSDSNDLQNDFQSLSYSKFDGKSLMAQAKLEKIILNLELVLLLEIAQIIKLSLILFIYPLRIDDKQTSLASGSLVR